MLAGALEISLLADVARIKSDMDKATRIVGSGAKAMETAMAGVKAALGGIVAGLSVAALSNWIKGAIDAADSMSKLSQKIGVSTKDIAGLQLAYKLAGLESSAMQMSVARLSKGLIDNNKGLEALGIRTKETGGAFRSTKAVLHDVADQISKMPDGLQKTAIAVEIFGRAGAEMIPLLNGGSAGMREMDEMARKLGLTIDDETGKKAEQFNDTLELIGLGSQGVARGIMAQLLPTLQNLAGSFLTSMTEGDKLKNTANFLAAGLKILYSVAVGVVEVFSTVGRVIGGLAAYIQHSLYGSVEALSKLVRGDFSGAWDAMTRNVVSSGTILLETGRDVYRGWKETGSQISRAWTDEGNTAVQAAATTMGAQKDLLAAAKEREDAAKKAAAAAQKEAKAFAALVAKLNGRDSGTDADFLKNLHLLAAHGKKAGMPLAEIIRLQELYIEQQPYMAKAAKERQAEFARTAEVQQEAADAYVAEDKAREAARASVAAYAKGIGETREQLELELSLVGATEAARKRVLALDRIELDLKQQIAAIEDFRTGFDAAQREREKARARAAAAQARANVELQAELDVAAKVQQEWERTNQQIADSFVDNLMRGGKSVSEYLKDLFRTLVLRPLLAPVGQAMGGMVGAAIGTMPTAANAAGSGMLGSIAGSALGSSVMGGLGMFGQAAGATMTNMFAAGGTAMNMANIATLAEGGSMMGALGGAAPYIGLALAAASLLSGAFKGETRHGGVYENGQFVAGPSGGEINGEASSAAVSATMRSINETLRALGATATVSRFVAGMESSTKGRGYVFAGGNLSTGEGFGQGWEGTGYQNRRGSMTPEQAAAAFGEELKQATLQALQEAGVPGILGDYLRSLGDVDALSGGALDAALGRIQKALSEKQSLEDQYYTLTHTDIENLTRAREREREALDESNRALYDQVLALTDQKAAAEAAAAAQREIDQERYGLESQLLQLQGDTVELRRRELEAINPANRALQEQIWGLERMASIAAKVDGVIRGFLSPDGYRQYLAGKVSSGLAGVGVGISADQVMGLSREQYAAAFRQAMDVGAYEVAEKIADLAGTFLEIVGPLEGAATGMRDAAQTLRQNALSALSDAFGMLQGAVGREKQRLDKEYQKAADPLQSSIDAITASVGRLSGLSNTLRSSLDRFATTDRLGLSRSSASAQIEAALAIARSGGALPDAQALETALSVVAQPSEQLYGSFVDYAKAFDQQVSTITELSELTDGQLSTEKRALAAAEDQLRQLSAYHTDSLERLDGILAAAQAQADGFSGLTLSMSQAMALFANASNVATTVTRPGGAGSVDYTDAQIRDTFSVLGDNPTAAQIYQLAYQNRDSMSLSDLDAAAGWAPGTSAAWAESQNPPLPTFAVGADVVPYDMTARIHAGERILPTADNAALTRAIERMAVQIEQQGRQIDALVTHTYHSRKHLQEAVERGVGVYNAPGETLTTVAA